MKLTGEESPVVRWRRRLLGWVRRRRLRELVRVVQRGKHKPLEAARQGLKARRQLEALGGFWHRAREVLASRLDVLPQAFCRTLDGPDEGGSPQALHEARTVVEGALEGLFERRLEGFDEQPVRVTPFGQVHTATLKRTGGAVWVVVRRPDAERRLDEELVEMEYFFKRLSRARGLEHAPWERLMRELRASLRDGLDFRIQAHAMRELRKQVRRYPGARYPHVYQTLCRAEVLVAERVQAPSLAEVEARGADLGGAEAWFAEHHTDPEFLAGRLWKAFMRQLVEARTLVPAQGPGDILLLGQNEFCYRFEPFVLPLELGVPRSEAVHLLLHALLRRSYEGAFFPLLKLAEPLPPLEPHQLKKVVSREVRAWAQRAEVKTLPSDARSFGALFDTVLATTRRYPIVFDSAVLRACLQLHGLEDALFTLHPEFAVASELRRFFKRSTRRVARRLGAQLATPPAPDWEAIGQMPFNALETAQATAERLSRAALPFASEPTPTAFLVSRIAGFSSLLLWAVLGVLAVVAARLGSLITLSSESWVERNLVGPSPPDLVDVGLAMLITAFSAWGLRRLAVRFAERDSHLPTRGVV